jgi:nitrite reductase (NADH) large subunit
MASPHVLSTPARTGSRPRLVVVGNGMAPGRALERLMDAAPDAYDVTIFNAEPRVNYDRIMLSPLLSGEKSFDDIVIHGDGWYIKHGVTLYKGAKIVAIDRGQRTVTSDSGIVAGYDKLIIATGSVPIIIPVPGHALPGVLTYRDLDDVQGMILAAQARGKAVVIGGGLLGLEAAAGLNSRGMDVSVVHLMPTLMERQLDPAAGALLKGALEARGIRVVTGANTKAITGTSRVTGVELADGRVLPADLVVMAVGIRPNAQLAKTAGLNVNRGIVADDSMRTSDPDIFALGECAECAGQVYGLVAPLYEMANVVAAHLIGPTPARFQPSAIATKLKVTGINLFSAGDFAPGAARQDAVLTDPDGGVYKRLVIEDDRVVGCVLYGDTANSAWFFDLIRSRTDIGAIRDTLIFGPSYGTPEPAATVEQSCSLRAA